MNKPVFDPLPAKPQHVINKPTRTRNASVVLLFLSLFNAIPLLSQAARPASVATPPVAQSLLARHYQEGERIAYTIACVNQSPSKTTGYEARAEGVASKDTAGIFVENLAWTDLQVNGEQVRLLPASRAFHEPLSLAPGSKLAIPPLGNVQRGLIGPIGDLLTFYADVKIAMNQKTLTHAGDRAYVKFGAPNSWADGSRVIVGEDSVDFDVTLKSIDPATQIAILEVRHLPPAQPQIKLPAPWMTERVGNSANNWVEVERDSDGKYIAGVGQETFDAEIKMSLATGRILSATMDNPVEAVERSCTDAALTDCGSPEQHSVHRQITLRADSPPAQVAPR